MNKQIAALILSISLLSLARASDPSPTETPTPTQSPIIMGGCNLASWNTELYRFYGSRDAMIESVSKLPAEILTRRVFIQVTQGDSSAKITLYERQADDTFTVTQWTERQTSHLLAEIDRAIVANKGVNCVGEQVQNVLYKELGKGEMVAGVAAPVSAKAAFAHSLKETKGLFMQTAIWVLC
jgi:hypothetical protein